MSSAAEWKAFWDERHDPEHGGRGDDFFQLLWRELRLLMPDMKGRRLLDLGCGNGSFYRSLGFDQAAYVGVDLSQAMLTHFRELHPGVELDLGAVQTYVPSEPVDIIFSHGVIQYLSPEELRQHFDLARTYLRDGGEILHTGIPWARLRAEFELGGLDEQPRPRLKHYIGYIARAFSASPKLKGLGYWYSPAQYRAVALGAGFDVEFYGSLAYPYRFHARSTRRA